MEILGILAIIAGLVYVIGAMLNWNWLVSNRAGHLVDQLLGRRAARGLVFGVGVLLILSGVFFILLA
jgi:hypothetical protein